MNEQPVLNLGSRQGVGSNAVRKYRKQGMAPGIIYGHGESVPVVIDAHDFRMTIAPEHYGSQVVRLTVDGKDAGTALVKQVQINTVSRQILNIDYQRVSSHDRVNVSVPLVVEGESADARTGAVVQQSMHAVNIRCSAFNVPPEITLDISQMHIGDALHARELPLGPSCELADSPDEVILVIAAPTKPAGEETAAAGEAGIGPALTDEKQKDASPTER